MRILLKHLHHIPSPSIIEMIRMELEGLKPELQIDEARVLLERRLHQSPPFRAAFHLVTPGPDVAAEAEDHTLRAALLKAFGSVRDKIGLRHRKRKRSRSESSSTVSARRGSTKRSGR